MSLLPSTCVCLLSLLEGLLNQLCVSKQKQANLAVVFPSGTSATLDCDTWRLPMVGFT